MRHDQAGGIGVRPQDGPTLGKQPGMGARAGPGQVQALAYDAFGGEGPFHRRHVTLDPAAKAAGWTQQEHPARHAGFLSSGLTSTALLQAANVKFWVTMWPRSMPVSAARAIRWQALTACQTITRTTLGSPCATGGEERARTEPKPAAAASWRMLRAVTDVWWVKSPLRMCPQSGLTAFGTLPAKTPPGASAAAASSKVWRTSGLVRCSSRSVAVIAA